MKDHRRPALAGATRALAWTAIVLAGAFLQGCAHTQGEAKSTLRVYAADLSGGAKQCQVQNVIPAAGKTTEATMRVGNDGGWCGVAVHQAGPKPYEAGLLTERPAHGTIFIHEVGDDTRIDYTPDHGFAGIDNFSVKLIPGDAVIHVTATVTAATATAK